MVSFENQKGRAPLRIGDPLMVDEYEVVCGTRKFGVELLVTTATKLGLEESNELRHRTSRIATRINTITIRHIFWEKSVKKM